MLTTQTRLPPLRSDTPDTAPRGDVSQVRAILNRGLISVTDRQVPDVARLLDGSLPVNTGGGLVGFGHPVGATGIKQVLEVYRQMKGLCGDYQVPTLPRWGITANMGGDDKTVVSLALRNGS